MSKKEKKLNELYMQMADMRIGTMRWLEILDEINKLEKEIEKEELQRVEVKPRRRVM